MLTVFHDHKPYHVTVTSKPIRNVYLRIDRQGNLTASAPFGYPRDRLEKFCAEHVGRLVDSKKARSELERFNPAGATLHILDRPYQIKYVQRYGPPSVRVVAGTVYVHSSSLGKEAVSRVLKDYLTEMAKQRFPAMVENISRACNLPCSGITVRWSTGRWGSFSPSSKRMNLAAQLVGYGERVISYVIVHELCHGVHPDHSPDFWRLVERFCPDYKDSREVLAHKHF